MAREIRNFLALMTDMDALRLHLTGAQMKDWSPGGTARYQPGVKRLVEDERDPPVELSV